MLVGGAGFGSLARHLKRLTEGLDAAMAAGRLSAGDLYALQPYSPVISLTGAMQFTMGTRQGWRSAEPGLSTSCFNSFNTRFCLMLINALHINQHNPNLSADSISCLSLDHQLYSFKGMHISGFLEPH